MKNKVSVIIPTFNGLSLLKKNVPAVLSALRSGDELIIVDDASTDNTVSWFKEKFHAKKWSYKIKSQKFQTLVGRFTSSAKNCRTTLLLNKKNLRFARSCNRGVLLAKQQLIFLLNNDVSPQKDVISYLLPHFEDTSVFAVAPLEIENNLGGIKGGKNHLWFEKGLFMHRRSDEFTTGETAWVSGGSGLFDKEKWLKLGGFDAAFFPAYWEDIDLSFRARKRGWKTLFEEKAIVYHNHESTNQDVFGKKRIESISWKNSQLFAKKNSNSIQKVLYYFWYPYWWLKRL